MHSCLWLTDLNSLNATLLQVSQQTVLYCRHTTRGFQIFLCHVLCWWHTQIKTANGSVRFQLRCMMDESREGLVQCRCSMSHQRSFKVWCGWRRPGGRYDAVDWVLLLGVDVLHVERRAVLGLALGLLSVQAAVHATVAILCKECVDGLYPGLSAIKIVKLKKKKKTSQTVLSTMTAFKWTHHNGFSLKCFYFLSQILVCLGEHKRIIQQFMVQNFNWISGKVQFHFHYLLSICVWLECDVPVVVVGKLNTYHLWTVVIFEQRLHFLGIKQKKKKGLTLGKRQLQLILPAKHAVCVR